VHGAVVPVQPVIADAATALPEIARRSSVPVWLFWPLPAGWLLAGAGWAGDERSGARAVAVAYCGPAPRGGPADLVVVAEEPGIGWGSSLAGLSDYDPGPAFVDVPPALKVPIGGHPTSMWSVPAPLDRTVYVGEADGCWLWAIAWPDDAGLVLHGDNGLLDLRDSGWRPDLPCGAPTTRLRPGPVGEVS
jgi:hypothetical protein